MKNVYKDRECQKTVKMGVFLTSPLSSEKHKFFRRLFLTKLMFCEKLSDQK